MLKKLVCLMVMVVTSLTLNAKSYNRIIVLEPAIVETIYMLGGEDRIVAIAHSTMTGIEPIEKTSELPSVGTILKPSFEKVISYKPDLVIVNMMNNEIIDNLKRFNIDYVELKLDSFDNFLESILKVGVYVNKENEAKELYNTSIQRLEAVKNALRENPLNLKGTFIYNASPLMTFGSGTVQSEILLSLGVEDIGRSAVGQRPILSPEYIVKTNPDFLIGILGVQSRTDLIKANEYLLRTKAGRSSNIHVLSTNRIMRMSPYIIDEIEEIYKFLSNIN